MSHPAIAPGRVAVITGGASGIGLAAAHKFAATGMKIVLADLRGDALDQAAASVATVAKGGQADVRAVPTDVAVLEDVQRMKQIAYQSFGEVAVLMNNAGIGNGGGPFEHYERWQRVLSVNLWGVINGAQVFTQAMVEQGTPAAIINTGSKQGITTPPGDTAYNVSKAGVKVITEGLAHALRNIEGGKVTAHLLIPGHVWTGITGRKLDQADSEKPKGAWTPEQTVDFMLEHLNDGDFYVLCPDNDVPHALDARRIQWAADDIIQNRPALSRWHPDWKDQFAAYVKDVTP
ncbi:SDR family NAD(P)-dependent oxidoreductase [Dongia deserti]|uniref:SDR family NAD(P)-dependent oxidoreductase n=1 Tax=Dongia deserti TaxID=2268030 RepID=UPI000E65D28B|nr:SDR family NAD(P)-dependent oxidoreductase [Dongia deserti]